nr:phospholipase-like protein [Tanacetum cinerariifolium]
MYNSYEIFEAKISVRSKMQYLQKMKLRVSLLFVLEIVFMGREEFFNVPLHILTLAEDFFAWNSFPWGEYMWRYFYKRTLNVVKNHVAKDSIPNLVLFPTSGELKADWLVRCQYYFNGEDAPFIQSVKPKCSDFKRCDSKVVDYVKAGQEDFPRLENIPVDLIKKQDCTLVEQAKNPTCSTSVRLDAVRNQDVPLVDSKKMTTYNLNGFVWAQKFLMEDSGLFWDTQPSTMEHLVSACAFVSPPLPFSDSLKPDKFVEPAQVTSVIDDCIDIENNPSKYCLDNMTIGIEEDTQNGELTLQMIKTSEVNVVKGDGKPVLGKVFEGIRRIKKPGIFKQAPYMQQRPTTQQVKKNRKRFNNLKPIDFSLPAPSALDGSQETL